MLSSTMDTTAASRSLRQDAYELILQAIVFGDLPSGTKLDEKSLAQEFQVGIAGIRDALLRLALEGLIIRQPRIGTTIAGLDVKELQDVFEARIILECQCARLAAQRADAQDVEKIRETIQVYRNNAATRDFRLLFKIDQIFHRTIAHATKNVFLEKQVVILHNNASRFWCQSIGRREPEALEDTLHSHIAVANAIIARDPIAAERAMRTSLSRFPWVARLMEGATSAI